MISFVDDVLSFAHIISAKPPTSLDNFEVQSLPEPPDVYQLIKDMELDEKISFDPVIEDVCMDSGVVCVT
jgi:hypothetical protein